MGDPKHLCQVTLEESASKKVLGVLRLKLGAQAGSTFSMQHPFGPSSFLSLFPGCDGLQSGVHLISPLKIESEKL
jgi:hypothetical protein